MSLLMTVVQAFRPAVTGGPEGPHYIEMETALASEEAGDSAAETAKQLVRGAYDHLFQ
jgi:hypothetical protein